MCGSGYGYYEDGTLVQSMIMAVHCYRSFIFYCKIFDGGYNGEIDDV